MWPSKQTDKAAAEHKQELSSLNVNLIYRFVPYLKVLPSLRAREPALKLLAPDIDNFPDFIYSSLDRLLHLRSAIAGLHCIAFRFCLPSCRNVGGLGSILFEAHMSNAKPLFLTQKIHPSQVRNCTVMDRFAG